MDIPLSRPTPPHEVPFLRYLPFQVSSRRLTTILAAGFMLVAPEVMLATAVEQCLDAYLAKRYINDKADLSGEHRWTMVDGFFVVMKGYMYHGEKGVSKERVVELYKRGHLPKQSRATEIRDKSKSDSFSKFLTCAQAVWFFLQCVARFRQGLTMTTLELSTVGYVVIAVFINVLLWAKPRDVRTRLELGFPPSSPLITSTLAMTIRPSQSAGHQTADIVCLPGARQSVDRDRPSDLVHMNGSDEDVHSDAGPRGSGRDSAGSITRANTPDFNAPPDVATKEAAFRTDDFVESAEIVRSANRPIMSPLDAQAASTPNDSRQLSPVTSRASVKFKARLDRMINEHRKRVFFVAWYLICSLYGVWHFISPAQNFEFPSRIEGQLWFICSIASACSGPVFLSLWYLNQKFLKLSDGVLKAVLVLMFLVFYVPCRGFIVVEMFVGLRRLPEDVYRSIEWTRFLPHF